jgi:branched-chain amino acid transport system permease protein
MGVMGVVNLSHGALYMVGGYIGWTLAIKLGLNYWLAVLAGGVTSGLIGLAINYGFLRHLHKMFDEQVLLTIGFVYILTNLCLWIFGSYPKSPFTASFLDSSINIIGGWTYSNARIAIIIIGIALAIGLWWLIDKTRIGAIVRAGMQDKEMTTGLGINYGLTASVVFFLGCFIAGAAGTIGAELFGVNLNLGWDILLLAMVVVVVGGTGSAQGALLGSILIGLIISFGTTLFPDLSMFFIYLAMVVILLVKPSGLLGRRI